MAKNVHGMLAQKEEQDSHHLPFLPSGPSHAFAQALGRTSMQGLPCERESALSVHSPWSCGTGWSTRLECPSTCLSSRGVDEEEEN